MSNLFHPLDRATIERAVMSPVIDVSGDSRVAYPRLVLDGQEYEATLLRQGIYRTMRVSGKAETTVVQGMEFMHLDFPHSPEQTEFRIDRYFLKFQRDDEDYAIRDSWKMKEHTRFLRTANIPADYLGWVLCADAPSETEQIQYLLRNLEEKQ